MVQVIHTQSQGGTLQTNAKGTIKQHLTDKPTATAFRYVSARFTVFGQAYFFENFDQGAGSSYLGDTLKHTCSRNCDGRGLTLFRYERPGIGNYQAFLNGATPDVTLMHEVLHKDLVARYNDVAGQVATAEIGVAEDGANFLDTRNDYFVACDGESQSAPTAYKRSRSGQPFYSDGFGWAAIKSCEYSIGGQRMNKIDGDTCYCWHVLNCAGEGIPNKAVGLAYSRDNNDFELKRDSMTHRVCYAPLMFSFCRSPAMMAPLISTMYNSLTLDVEFRAWSKLVCNLSVASGSSDTNEHGTVSQVMIKTGDMSAALAGITHATVDQLIADTVFYTRKRKNEDTLANARLRGSQLATANDQDNSDAVLAASDLARTDFPVSVVSLNYFLGPSERAAFASSSFYQIVEPHQRLKMTSTTATSLAFRTDQFQNAASALYVIPKWPGRLAGNEHFSYGGNHNHVAGEDWPAISQMEFTTNGATQQALTDESFFNHVQAFGHHSRCPKRRVYSINFGMKANGRGPVQCIGYINLSRTTNSILNVHFMQNLWTRNSTDVASGTSGFSNAEMDNLTALTLTVNLHLSNYNILQFIGGIAGYKYLQVNQSV